VLQSDKLLVCSWFLALSGVAQSGANHWTDYGSIPPVAQTGGQPGWRPTKNYSIFIRTRFTGALQHRHPRLLPFPPARGGFRSGFGAAIQFRQTRTACGVGVGWETGEGPTSKRDTHNGVILIHNRRAADLPRKTYSNAMGFYLLLLGEKPGGLVSLTTNEYRPQNRTADFLRMGFFHQWLVDRDG